MRKHHTPAFKAQVVREMLREEKPISQIATAHGLHPNMLHKWKAQALEGLPGLFEERDSTGALKAAHEQQLTEFYAQIGRLTTQLGWLKRKSGIEHVQG